MKRTISMLAGGCLAWAMIVNSPVLGAKILFFQDPAAAWAVDIDEPLIAYFESLGHVVTPYNTALPDDPDNIGQEQLNLANSHDLVYVTESLGSGTTHDGLETWIKTSATPQIWAEAYAWDESAMTADVIHQDFGNTQRAEPVDPDLNPVDGLIAGQVTMNIVTAGHPLAGGFTGAVKVYEEEYSLNWGQIATMGKGATVIATVPDAPNYASYFVYEKGTKLEDDTAAAGMRIGMWLGQAGTGSPIFDNITADGKKLIDASLNYALGISTAKPGDFDGDGDLDAADINALSAAVRGGANPAQFDLNKDSSVNAADRKVWVSDLKKTYFGDANLDREFNSGDFVAVFTVGKYESVQTAEWQEGDWNGDNKFDSGDFVEAFTEGGYEKGPHPAVSAVPEPSSIGLLALVLLTSLGLIRRR